MAAPKLTKAQKYELLRLIAADYSNRVIFSRLSKIAGFPVVGASALSYYRAQYAEEIEQTRKARLASALNRGLALKEERVIRLSEHADELELVKWEPGENGRYWNEKAWRETLDDIAQEMGDRRSREKESGEEEIIKLIIGVDLNRV